MPIVKSNVKIAEHTYMLTIEGQFEGRMGQFYMVRAWSDYPVLSRPISIYDIQPESIVFLYHVVGEGTERFAALEQGDSIDLEGPFGNGFLEVSGKVALVGGGIGIAPLYFAARQLNKPDIYLGFSREAYLVEAFKPHANEVVCNVGGMIVNEIDYSQYDAILTCGPHVMMKALAERAKDSDAEVYVSLEKRMACGIGACLVCSVICQHGNKKACVDGPVFKAKEVNFDAEYGV
ncbi:dihydroorotate dehydrogenase electron transfer subunit [Paenibacillus selenitireducens]|uniref:Dihydroorotate dehydrogenase electron transfer subunit n=1 Tax=Paenibacillus selenitireducens TaxID=1324314 RepID=A0A1T2X4X0_9BACL|nr:dihydroorotate dehydrogenase electron transfer subunit [Paenibacillus selenitireducens]OPA74623.1 dihydroorotate dehydrogenase electron transfer subunit [Paenibacillus selenitireducens]